MLPRHRTDEHGWARIDLPHSEFAYGQLDAAAAVNNLKVLHFGRADDSTNVTLRLRP